MTVKILVIRGASLEKRELARTLRNGMTNAEKMLWTELRRRSCGGYSFRRQQVLLGFIVDFYCAEKKLIVELDGPIHDSQRAEDDARVRILSDAGFKIIRFKNTEVFIDIDKVVWQIRQKLDP
jgi:leucyl-tRNA synthetase